MNISNNIRLTTRADVHVKGSSSYEIRRKVSNGLCQSIFPDLVVVPKSTDDVSKIVQIARRYNVSISIRSGGHSFICTSIKPGKYEMLKNTSLTRIE